MNSTIREFLILCDPERRTFTLSARGGLGMIEFHTLKGAFDYAAVATMVAMAAGGELHFDLYDMLGRCIMAVQLPGRVTDRECGVASLS